MPGPLVGVTQRTVPLPRRGEVRDCLDQAWAVFLAACGLEMVPLPTRLADPLAWVDRLGLAGVVLSGGNNLPPAEGDLAPGRDRLERALVLEAGPTLKVLGVCRGMQMLNLAHGGRLRPIPGHAGGTHLLAPGPGAWAGPDLPKGVNSFHDYGLLPADLASGLKALALAEDGSVEALAHEALPHLGIMWHPERGEPRPTDLELFAWFFGAGR